MVKVVQAIGDRSFVEFFAIAPLCQSLIKNREFNSMGVGALLGPRWANAPSKGTAPAPQS
ncbi:MAG TPA: hypothetical protein V6C57_24480 [Coleofasciculaceae cyanobacterium]